jgi:hypothetical protein
MNRACQRCLALNSPLRRIIEFAEKVSKWERTMTVKPGSIDSIACAAEGMAGTAGAAALKKVRSLVNAAPAGRAFAAIATLSELSQTAEGHLRAGKDALERGSLPSARKEWTSAVKVMDQMASEARDQEPALGADNPTFLHRR